MLQVAQLLALLVFNEAVYTYYVPYAAHRNNIGVAWYPPQYGEQDLTIMNATYYYNASSYLLPDDRAIPIIRHHIKNTVYESLQSDYDGYMLVGNEGEQRGQDNLTSLEMAEFIIEVRNRYQSARFVCLNSYSIDYMLKVIALLPQDVCQVYGVHIYENIDIKKRLDRLCDDCQIWITEIGWHYHGNGDEYDILYKLVSEALLDSRVGRVFAYTTRDGAVDTWNMLDDNGDLLPTGRAFVNAQQR